MPNSANIFVGPIFDRLISISVICFFYFFSDVVNFGHFFRLKVFLAIWIWPTYQLGPGLSFENIFPRNEIFFLFHLSRMNGIWRSLLIRLLSLRALVHTYFNSRGTGRIDKVEKMRYQQLFQKPDKQDRFTTCLKTCGTGSLF